MFESESDMFHLLIKHFDICTIESYTVSERIITDTDLPHGAMTQRFWRFISVTRFEKNFKIVSYIVAAIKENIKNKIDFKNNF